MVRLSRCRLCYRLAQAPLARGQKRSYASTALPANSDVKAPPRKSSYRFTQADLGLYGDTPPPTLPQIRHANSVFQRNHVASFLFSCQYFRELPMDSTTAEVAFLGRANVGKSSLINALLGALDAPIAHSSVRAGRTRLMNFYGLGCSGGSASATIQRAQESTVAKKWIRDGQVILVDTPGYGMSSNADVGEEIIKYLKSRKQFKRAFVLINATAGVKPSDMEMLNLLRIHAIPHQLIVNKVDERLFDVKKASSSEDMFNAVLELRKVWSGMQAKLQLGRAASFSEMLFCSSVRTKFHRSDEPTRRVEGPLGIDGLRWAILQAAGKDCYESGKPRLTNVLERQMLRRLEKTVY